MFCGADVSDQGRQYCVECEREVEYYMNDEKAKELHRLLKQREYRQWLLNKPPKWRIIKYIKWLRSEPTEE